VSLRCEPRRFGGVLEFGRDLARADGSAGIAVGPRVRDDCGHAVTLAGRETKTENSDRFVEGSSILATH
jgi:hypothetical protein